MTKNTYYSLPLMEPKGISTNSLTLLMFIKHDRKTFGNYLTNYTCHIGRGKNILFVVCMRMSVEDKILRVLAPFAVYLTRWMT